MADRAKYLVQSAEQQKKQIIIRATGEARATELFGISMAQSPVFLELKRVEAARSIAKIIGNGQNKVYLESDSLMMNLTQGFNQNLERKTDADKNYEREMYNAQNAERQIAHAKFLQAEEKLQDLKKKQK